MTTDERTESLATNGNAPQGAVANSARGTLTVWSDIGCPWASLALHTLRGRARDRGQDLVVDHRVFPLELFNSQPTPKYIVDAEVVAIGGIRRDLGWKLWSGPESSYPVTTLPAMEAVQAAKDPAVGGLPASDQLDAALRHAFYAESRCISIPSVILDVARECDRVDADRLGEAIVRGAGRAEVYADWSVAQGPDVQGSPHLFTANGFAAHNPGATYHWTAAPPAGLPRLESYSADWVDDLLDQLRAAGVNGNETN